MTGVISTRKCYFYTTCLNIISRNSKQYDISRNVNVDFDVRLLNLSGLSGCFFCLATEHFHLYLHQNINFIDFSYD